MFIGSNNSLTYLRPSSWWSKVFKWFRKCQSADYKEQYTYCGVRFFDFHLYADNHCHVIIKNGKYKYNLFSFYEILKYLNDKGDVTLNVVFEASLYDKDNDIEYKRIEKKFTEICGIMEVIYPNIRYIGGYRKYDGEKLYTFKYEAENGTPNIIDMSNNIWLYRFFPILSSFRNRYYIKKYKNENGFLLLNFVDRR